MVDQHGGHVHCYDAYPGSLRHCLTGDGVPVLEIGDHVTTADGRAWDALPRWSGAHLVVERDKSHAQVATRRRAEPSGSELRELASTGGTANA
jgi:hypothetical protein